MARSSRYRLHRYNNKLGPQRFYQHWKTAAKRFSSKIKFLSNQGLQLHRTNPGAVYGTMEAKELQERKITETSSNALACRRRRHRREKIKQFFIAFFFPVQGNPAETNYMDAMSPICRRPNPPVFSRYALDPPPPPTIIHPQHTQRRISTGNPEYRVSREQAFRHAAEATDPLSPVGRVLDRVYNNSRIDGRYFCIPDLLARAGGGPGQQGSSEDSGSSASPGGDAAAAAAAAAAEAMLADSILAGEGTVGTGGEQRVGAGAPMFYPADGR